MTTNRIDKILDNTCNKYTKHFLRCYTTFLPFESTIKIFLKLANEQLQLKSTHDSTNNIDNFDHFEFYKTKMFLPCQFMLKRYKECLESILALDCQHCPYYLIENVLVGLVQLLLNIYPEELDLILKSCIVNEKFLTKLRDNDFMNLLPSNLNILIYSCRLNKFKDDSIDTKDQSYLCNLASNLDKVCVPKNCKIWPTCSNQWKLAQYTTSTQKNLAKNCKIDWPIELFEKDPFPTINFGVFENQTPIQTDKFDNIMIKRKLICHEDKKLPNLEVKISKISGEALKRTLPNKNLIHPIPIKKIILQKPIQIKSPTLSAIQTNSLKTFDFSNSETKSNKSDSTISSIETIIGLEEDLDQKLLYQKEQKHKFYKQNLASSVDSFLKFKHVCGSASPSSMSTGSATSGYTSSSSVSRKRSYQSLIDLTDENFQKECSRIIDERNSIGSVEYSNSKSSNFFKNRQIFSKNSSFRKVDDRNCILDEIKFLDEEPYVYDGGSFDEIKRLLAGQYYDEKHKSHWRISDIVSLLSLLKLFGANSYTLIKDLNLSRFARFKRNELKAKFQSLERSNYLRTINLDKKLKTFQIENVILDQVVGVNSSRQKVFIISNLDRFGNNLYRKIIG